METKNLLSIIIAVAVGIIMVGSLLMPYILDSSDKPITVSNDINRPATLIDSSDDVNVVINLGYTTPSFTINGEAVERDTSVTWYQVIASDGFSIVYNWLDSEPLIAHNNYGQSISVGVSEAVTQDMTITITKGNINVAYGSYSFDRSFTWASYLDPSGNGDYQNFFAYSGLVTKIYFKEIGDLKGASSAYTTPVVFYAFEGEAVRLNPFNENNMAGTTTATVTSNQYLHSDIRVLDFGRNYTGYNFTFEGQNVSAWQIVAPTTVSGTDSPLGSSASIMLLSIPAVLIVALVASIAMMYRR